MKWTMGKSRHLRYYSLNWQQPANCLIVFDYFVGLALKELNRGKFFRYTFALIYLSIDS